jgi:transposase-like protein
MMGGQLKMTEGKQRKHYTIRQKLEILREWESAGSRSVVSERYGVHSRTLYRWKKKLRQGGDEFLEGSLSELSLRVEELERENQVLKDTVISLSQDLMLLKKNEK